MRKLYFFLFFITLITSKAFAFGFGYQTDPLKKSSGSRTGSNLVTYAFSLSGNQLHEVRVEHFFHDRWSLLYTMGFATGPSGGGYSDVQGYNEFRAPIGASIGVGILSATCATACCGYSNFDGAFSLFALSCMIPDGIAYHMPISDRFSLSPYVNLSGLSYQWIGNDSSQGEFVYSPMGGFRVICPLSKDFVFMAEQNIRRVAGGSFVSSTGASLSISF